jgi:putative endonuclease
LESRYVTGRYTGRAEIDIIARRGKIFLFIEVKNRPTPESGVHAVTFAQAVRLRRAAGTYLTRHAPLSDARFDIIVVSGLSVRWIKNAF